MSGPLRIGDLARELSVSAETIRYYEKARLLPGPERSGGNYRLYSPHDVERLRFILNCRELDMAHGEIRTLLHFRDAPTEHCDHVNELLDEHIEHVAQRISQLTQMEKQLRQLRRTCAQAKAAQACGILHGLAKRHTAAAKSDSGAAHIPGTHRRRSSVRSHPA